MLKCGNSGGVPCPSDHVGAYQVAIAALSADLSEYGGRLLLAFLSCDVLLTVLRVAHLIKALPCVLSGHL